ncbi:MAG: hypothetical protein QN189_01090 [Armatimonadota bacterium]|nr:hypothetical protein [Armatimonadota bacterium]
MELVVDDLRIPTAVGTEAVIGGPAHVNDCMRDLSGSFLAEPAPEALEVLLRSSLVDSEHLRATRSFQGADQGPVVVPFAHSDLIGSRTVIPSKERLAWSFWRIHFSMAFTVPLCSEWRSLQPALLSDHLDQGPCNPCPLGHEGQRLQLGSTVRALDAVAPNPEEGQILQPGEVLHLDPSAEVCRSSLRPYRPHSKRRRSRFNVSTTA